MTNNLTVIIPTHERHHLLSRALHYYSSINVSVLIVDSSLRAFKEKLPDNINYLHLADAIMGEKIYAALNEINTLFVCLCADDDFLSENGLKQGLKFLKKNLDFVGVQGQYINFDASNLESINPMYIDCINYSNTANDISERYQNCFSAPYVYALHRTKVLKHCFEITLELSSLSLVEICIPLVSLLLGKQKTLPIFWEARDRVRYSKYLNIEGSDYSLNKPDANINIDTPPSVVVEDWGVYLCSTEGVQFRKNFILKATNLVGNSINANDLFELAFDSMPLKKVDFSLLTLNDKVRYVLKKILPNSIVKKIKSKKVENFIKLNINSGFPWNDENARNDWNLIKKTIVKFPL